MLNANLKVGLDVGAIGSISLFGFGSGWTLSIWLFVIIFIKSFSIGFGYRLDVIKSPAIAKPCSLAAIQINTLKAIFEILD